MQMLMLERRQTRPAVTDMDTPADGRSLWSGLSPRRVLAVGLPTSVLLAVVSMAAWLLWHDAEAGPGYGLLTILDVDREGSLPTWFSSVLLLSSAASLATLAGAPGRWRRQWGLLALAFLYLSLDEVAELHEQTIEPVRGLLDLGGAFYYAWVVVAVPIVVGLGVVLLPFLRSLPSSTRRAFLLGGALFLGGAVGLEMVGGLIADAGGQGSALLHAVVTVEELLEMVGTTVFLAAVNAHRDRFVERLAVRPAESASL